MGKQSLQYKYSKGMDLNSEIDSVYPELKGLSKDAIVQSHDGMDFPTELKSSQPLMVVHLSPSPDDKHVTAYSTFYSKLSEDLSEFNVGMSALKRSELGDPVWGKLTSDIGAEVDSLGHLVLIVSNDKKIIRSIRTSEKRIAVEPKAIKKEVFHILFDMRDGSPSRPYNDLTDFESYVLDKKGTERAYTGEYWNHKADGLYTCRKCKAPLYWSQDKFDSHCGWPSFDDEINSMVIRRQDVDGFRTEIICGNCKGHLGHVFLGEGFTEKDTRHCVNSVSIEFKSLNNE